MTELKSTNNTFRCTVHQTISEQPIMADAQDRKPGEEEEEEEELDETV